ncbi:DUF6046 domain-containing protein [Mucilaginibacter angelicae]|uniref:DUF6046 domain-containing protein n=1 Tax=Mucilaginibacter angelicae TaxID=869718 RepID=A0ABV6L4Z7_9SPHI
MIQSDTVFDIAAIFRQLYGYKPAQIPELPSAAAERSYNFSPRAPMLTNPYGNSYYSGEDTIGREVFCPLTIMVGQIEYFFPYTVIGFEREKMIKETEMSEAGGTAKQIISMKDWSISVKGFVIGYQEQLPGDELQALKYVFQSKEEVRLKSAYSDLFLSADDRVLIYKLSIPEKPRVIGVRDFAMEMKSDSILKLTIDSNSK